MVDFSAMARKWQQRWEEKGAFHADIRHAKNPCYVLEMFPYPSAYGIHMGHARNYSLGDAYARFMRMRGHEVLYPMGYDSFGLPAENAAIKNNVHPRAYTEKAIENITAQLKAVGFSYDWSKTLATSRPEYYRWTQWLFLQLYRKNLAVKRTAPINWCPSCQTVLANEQVEQGRCWRCKSEVGIRDLEQWFFRITEYAQELLDDLDKLAEWPERIKLMQRNWIGRSTGTRVRFRIKDSEDEVEVFTTRPDTLFGVTFLTFAPEHPMVLELVKGQGNESQVKEFINKVVIGEKFERTAEDRPKEGLFTGRYAIHPLTGEEIPIWIANFVLLDYGTGCVMGVPAHDQRDNDFARRYDLPIRQVIAPSDHQEAENIDVRTQAYAGPGVLVKSPGFDSLRNEDAKEEITKELERQGKGGPAVQFKIRDWLLSRQRYWGCPIPVVYCDACGVVPVPEDQLPVLLPDDVQFTGEGNPLATSKSFVNTMCPQCGKPARRETDTMDTFVDSSWYFLRYTDPGYGNGPFDKGSVDKFLPVDCYIGGAEHAVMHLLYARFFTKALRDMKLLKFDEPFTSLRNQGMVTLGGTKMSKSLGNVVDPIEVMQKYGPDTMRFFLLFVAAPDSDLEWSDEGIEGAHRFVWKAYGLGQALQRESGNAKDAFVESRRNAVIRDATAHIDGFVFNKALIAIMDFVNLLAKYRDEISDTVYRSAVETLARLLVPFTPHLAEELWEMLGNDGFVSLAAWPSYDGSKIDERAEQDEEFIRETVSNIRRIVSTKGIKEVTRITFFPAEGWKHDFVREFRAAFGEIKNPKLIAERLAQLPALAQHQDEVAKLVFSVIKNMKLLPLTDRTAQEERALLEQAAQELHREFGAAVLIGDPSSAHPKAKQGLPERPATVIE